MAGNWEAEFLIEMYLRMATLRKFEEAGERRYRRGEIIGSYHSSIGQEATYVGSAMALKKEDYITGTHRSHGHPIAKGADLPRLAAEILGKQTGVCKGKGGSKHLADFSVGSLGESGIVSGAMPVAVGAALAVKTLGEDRVVMCYFGDGAANEGLFHESLNLASVWKLPVVFLCENNQYSVSTWYRDTTSVEFNSKRAPGYNMPGVTVDGQNALEVHRACEEAVTRARAGLGPSLVECMTYRYREHTLMMVFAPSPGMKRVGYRTRWEIEQWERRDPLEILKSFAVAEGLVSEATLQAVAEDAEAKVEAAWQFAEQSPPTSDAEIWLDTWVEPVSGGQLLGLR